MADKNKPNPAPAAEPRKKSDVILEKLDYLLSSSNEMVGRLDKSVASSNYISRQNSEIYERTLEDNANTRQQVKYIAAQNQNVFDKISSMINELSEKVESLQKALEKPQEAEEKTEIVIDYDALAEAVSARIDCEEIAKNVAGILTADGALQARREEPAATAAQYEAEELPEGEGDEPYGIDYDLIADKVAERMISAIAKSDDGDISLKDIKEEISADYIATRVADQIIIPDPDYDRIADAVFDRLYQDTEDGAEEDDDIEDDGIVEEEYEPTDDELEQFAADEDALPEYEPVDCEKIASLVVEKLVASDEEYAEQEYEALDYEKLADLISERVFRDDGQGEEIEEEQTVEFDYDKLAEAIAAKICETEEGEEPAEGEIAETEDDLESSVKLTEETLAQIVDEISKRVCEFLPEQYDIVVDDEGCTAIADAIREGLSLANENGEFDIVIDEEGVAEISDGAARKVVDVTEKLATLGNTADERLSRIELDVSTIKNMLASGAVVSAAGELAAASALAEEPDDGDETPDDGEGGLVTVSDVIGEEAEEAAAEAESAEDVVEFIEQPETEGEVEEIAAEEEQSEPETEEQSEEAEAEEQPESDGVIEEIINDIDEQPVEGEVMPDGMDNASASVDFANMMKYNRSFIARIIQGSDDVKTYYGQTKTALLSYKKVNSSVAWGAERFNKGRETIAKFKIRGKTLCLYLALDPKEYKTSVYHQVDVSDNKSMATTPMMVKIKSPLGVKKAIRLIDDMLAKRGGVKQNVVERDYVAMYPYETMEELIEDGLVKDVSKK